MRYTIVLAGGSWNCCWSNHLFFGWLFPGSLLKPVKKSNYVLSLYLSHQKQILKLPFSVHVSNMLFSCWMMLCKSNHTLKCCWNRHFSANFHCRKIVAEMSDVLAADPTLPSAGWNRTAVPWTLCWPVNNGLPSKSSWTSSVYFPGKWGTELWGWKIYLFEFAEGNLVGSIDIENISKP